MKVEWHVSVECGDEELRDIIKAVLEKPSLLAVEERLKQAFTMHSTQFRHEAA